MVFTFSDRALHISHYLPVLVVEELHPYLGHLRDVAKVVRQGCGDSRSRTLHLAIRMDTYLASRTRAADDLHNDSAVERKR